MRQCRACIGTGGHTHGCSRRSGGEWEGVAGTDLLQLRVHGGGVSRHQHTAAWCVSQLYHHLRCGCAGRTQQQQPPQ